MGDDGTPRGVVAVDGLVAGSRGAQTAMSSSAAIAGSPTAGETASARALLCRARGSLVAVRLEEVIETMRPLAVTPVGPRAGAHDRLPGFVLGLSLVRGAAIPVVDLGAMLGVPEAAAPRRFVTVRVGARAVALAVEEVVGIRALPVAALEELPPLLREVGAAVAAVGAADAELLVVLRLLRAVPTEIWAALEAARGSTP
jgi:purine-binding chemotaxis protein CheW